MNIFRRDESEVSDLSRVNDKNEKREFTVFAPFMTTVLLLFFLILPFSQNLSVSRIRFEKTSFTSELLRQDILKNLDHVIDKKKSSSFFKYKSLRNFINGIYQLCQESIWAKDCKVDFLLPDLAVVDFVEVYPAGFLIDEDKVFLISQDAEKLTNPISISYIYESGLNKLSLPFIQIRSQRCDLHEVVSFISYLRSMNVDFVDQIICLDFSLEVFTKDGYKVILPKEDINTAFAKFMKLREEMVSKEDIGKVSEFDVRGVEKIFVK